MYLYWYKYYNNMHKSSKNSPNKVFYSKVEELYGKILEDLKIIFKPNG